MIFFFLTKHLPLISIPFNSQDLYLFYVSRTYEEQIKDYNDSRQQEWKEVMDKFQDPQVRKENRCHIFFWLMCLLLLFRYPVRNLW